MAFAPNISITKKQPLKNRIAQNFSRIERILVSCVDIFTVIWKWKKMELNPIYTRIDDYQARTQVLRGYL